MILDPYDDRRAFDSGIYAQILVGMRKRGMDSSIVRSKRDINKNLILRVRLQEDDLSEDVSVA